MRLWEKVGNLSKYMTIGNAFVSKFLVPINFVLLLIANMKLFNIGGSIWIYIGLFVLGLSASLVVGFFYDWSGLWKQELRFDAERNPILIELRKHRKWMECGNRETQK